MSPSGGSGRRRIEVDGDLDRGKQFRNQLYLVDDHEAAVLDDPVGSSFAARSVAGL